MTVQPYNREPAKDILGGMLVDIATTIAAADAAQDPPPDDPTPVPDSITDPAFLTYANLYFPATLKLVLDHRRWFSNEVAWSDEEVIARL